SKRDMGVRLPPGLLHHAHAPAGMQGIAATGSPGRQVMRRTILPGLLLLGLAACGSSDRGTRDGISSDDDLRSSQAYQYAVKVADESAAVHREVGTPLHVGTVQEEKQEHDGAADNHLLIRVFGPEGAGTLNVTEPDANHVIQVRFVADSGRVIALPKS